MIRLLIADDHPVVREGLKHIVLECSDMRLMGEAADNEEVIAMCEQVEVDILLLDISMPGSGFFEVLQRIVVKHSAIRVLVFSIHLEDHYAVRALKAGAAGHLSKNYTPDELIKAIRQVYTGRTYVTLELAEKIASQLHNNSHNIILHETLSNREYQILCMLGTGKDTNEISGTLNLSPKTISTYKSRILDKMKLKTKGELIRYAVEHELAL